MIAERCAYAVRVGCDEDFTAIEHNVAPWRALLRLAATRRIGRRIAAVEPFHLDGVRQIAHHREQAMLDGTLREVVDDGISRLRVRA